jgi:hypothetical protein
MAAMSRMKLSRLEPAVFHLRQLVFPVAGQLGLAEFFHLQAAQQRHQLEGLGGGDQLAPFAQHVFLGEQPFDDGRARGRRAQAFFLHGFAQLVVFDPFAGAFHGAQQRGFAVAGGRAGLQRLGFDVVVAHHLAGLHRHQRFAVLAVALFRRRLPCRRWPASRAGPAPCRCSGSCTPCPRGWPW